MNKLVLLPLLCIAAVANAKIIDFYGPNLTENKEWHEVMAGDEFGIRTHLSVTPCNSQPWKLVSYKPCSLIEEVFLDHQAIGDAGMQTWFFKNNSAGNSAITFEREVNGKKEQRVIQITIIDSPFIQQVVAAKRAGCACDFGLDVVKAAD